MSEPTAPEIPGYLRLLDHREGNLTSCFFEADMPATVEVVISLGHEPNGYFWQGVVLRLIEQGQLPELETDPEGGMFCAYGERPAMENLARVLTPYLTDAGLLTELVTQAEAQGFVFDD